MRSLIVAFLCFLVACTKAGVTPAVNVTVPVTSAVTTSAGQTQTPEEEQKTEEEEEAALEKLPSFPAKPVLKGEPSPEDGILFSPRHAAEAALDAAEADKLTIENRVISNTREKEMTLLEGHVKKQDDDLAMCRRKSWWDRHGNETMLGTGVALGIALSLSVFKISAKIATSEN